MRRASGVIFCALAGAISAYYVRPYTEGNSDVVLVVVTIFSVFAGFLIATITIIGDPIMIREGSWRIAEAGRSEMQSRLFGHILLLFLYLITLGLLFVGVVLQRALHPYPVVTHIIEWAYLFFGITSFLLTFALPLSLLHMQQARYDAEIARRRRQAGIKEDNANW